MSEARGQDERERKERNEKHVKDGKEEARKESRNNGSNEVRETNKKHTKKRRRRHGGGNASDLAIWFTKLVFVGGGYAYEVVLSTAVPISNWKRGSRCWYDLRAIAPSLLELDGP